MVLADGCFDPIHVGHARYLREARRLCQPTEQLMVRVAPDTEIVAKGRSPFQTRHERVAMVCELASCAIDAHETLAAAIREIKPRVLVKGVDWHDRLPADVFAACLDAKTTIAYVNTQERSSTERLRGE